MWRVALEHRTAEVILRIVNKNDERGIMGDGMEDGFDSHLSNTEIENSAVKSAVKAFRNIAAFNIDEVKNEFYRSSIH
ncbi:MAG: hypothetical protein C0478_02650 [Planctomyces sp.]|nr:hypothetical protein [Planctomyces sp.]